MEQMLSINEACFLYFVGNVITWVRDTREIHENYISCNIYYYIILYKILYKNNDSAWINAKFNVWT